MSAQAVSLRPVPLTLKPARRAAWIVAIVVSVGLSGCLWAPKGKLNELQSQNRTLSEQNRTLLAEIENLRTHSRKVEDQLLDAEHTIAGSGEPGRKKR
jgi:hypothetical protein